MLQLPGRACVAITLGLLGLFGGAARAAEPGPAWAAVDSDLPQDPLLIDETLPNGLRYLILPNAEPKDRVSLRMLVAAGSLVENDDERGLAHFVEHMAFRGTREYPNGRMAETLQRLGIAFGPDSTAYTGTDHTIYHLELPDATAATLRTALHAFHEYAGSVTFAPELIERERGVVLSEMATRDTPESRARTFNLELLWPEARDVRRNPIGDASQIRKFTREQFVAFYDAWYRPERIALVVVGAADPGRVRKLIQSEFGQLAPRAPARPAPDDLIAADCAPPNVGVFRHPDIIGLWLGLEKAIHSPTAPDRHAARVQRLHRALAFAMFEIRLKKLADEGKTSFVDPNTGIGPAFRDWELASVGVNARVAEWKAATVELEMEHRRAVQFGFTAAELQEAKNVFKMQYEQAERSAATRPSPWLAQQLVGTLLQGAVFTTPAAARSDLAQDLEAAQLSDCLREFRSVWTDRSPSVFASANAAFEVNRQEIADVFNGSRRSAVTKPAEAAVPPFAYTDFGPAGTLVRDEKLEDLDVHLAEFANGAHLNFKATQFDADTVELRVRVGNGKQSQLLSRPGLDTLANAATIAGGVGRHTGTELNEILNGHALGLVFQVDFDTCLFAGRCAPREMDLLLRVIGAFLSDAGFRPEAMRKARPQFGSIIANLLATPSGPISMSALREMYSGDPRFGVPTGDEFMARDMGEVRAWLEPQFREGQLEISIVGDTTWAATQAAVAQTLGALPKRAPLVDAAPLRPVELAENRRVLRMYTLSPKLQQGAIAWFWPATEVVDIREERRCHLLAAILGERVRVKLREGLGSAYVNAVAFSRNDGFRNANFFSLYAEIAPRQLNSALQILRTEARDLSTKGPSADEFERARQPYLRAMTDDVRTNAYWAGTVLDDAQQRPNRIEAARNRATDIASITRADVTRLAKKYLNPDLAYEFATVPIAPTMK